MDSENVDLKALRDLLTIPMGVFLVGIATTGLIYGVHETFLYLYLQKELDASSQLISYMINIASASQALFLPFADKAVKFLGSWFLKLWNLHFAGFHKLCQQNFANFRPPPRHKQFPKFHNFLKKK